MYSYCLPDGVTPEVAKFYYAVFLKDTERFHYALERVVSQWPVSCEQFLSNESMNRIAWLGQSSMCIETGIPSAFRSGFFLLSQNERRVANHTADKYLRAWLELNNPEHASVQLYLDLAA